MISKNFGLILYPTTIINVIRASKIPHVLDQSDDLSLVNQPLDEYFKAGYVGSICSVIPVQVSYCNNSKFLCSESQRISYVPSDLRKCRQMFWDFLTRIMAQV